MAAGSNVDATAQSLIYKYLDDDTRALLEKVRGKNLPRYESLVFEGGGAKGVAYMGAVMVLEELGLFGGVHRFAGTSAGSISAALLALGLTTRDLIDFLAQDFEPLICDSWYGKFSFLPNIFRKYGWNPGKKFNQLIQDKIAEKMGDKNTTFWELYQTRKIELCLVGSNLTTSSVKYFHPKTTPHIPIAIAIQASMAIPGLLQPVELEVASIIVDGGLTCNFPVHCFDGWYLSMAPKHSFFHNLDVNDKPFGEVNKKTLGIKVYSMADNEPNFLEYEEAFEHKETARPDTILARSRTSDIEKTGSNISNQKKVMGAVKRLLHLLGGFDQDNKVPVEKLRIALSQGKLPEEDVVVLFGEGTTVDSIIAKLDKDGNDRITFQELSLHIESFDLAFLALLRGSTMQEISGVNNYFSSILNTIMVQNSRNSTKEEDFDRTIRINADYVYTNDFALEEKDKEFLLKQGILDTLCFLEKK